MTTPTATKSLFFFREKNVFFVSVLQVFLNLFSSDWLRVTVLLLTPSFWPQGLNVTKGLKVTVKVAQLCPNLCNPVDYTVHGILQARILEGVAFPFSRGSSQPRDQTGVSRTAGRFFTNWATRETIQYPMIDHNRKEHEKKSIYIYLQLNHFAVQQKLTHCKSTRLQLKILFFKKRKNSFQWETKIHRHNVGEIGSLI